MTDAKEDRLQDVGKQALSSIRDMVAALECDHDRLEELREERDDYDPNAGHPDDENYDPKGEPLPGKTPTWAERFTEEADELKQLEEAAGECKSRDDAEQRIMEDPLSIEYRSGWVTDKSEMVAEEVKILLTTGGPAVQIIVELADGQPHRAYLQVQDWGTPWTDYYEQGIGDALMAYVNCFCFE